MIKPIIKSFKHPKGKASDNFHQNLRLSRTANAMPHSFTRKVPREEWLIEKPMLKSYTPEKVMMPMMVYLDIDADLDAVRQTVAKDLHRIYPIFEKVRDNIVGVVALKELFLANQSDDFRLRNFTRPAHYLPDTTSAYKALEKFKASRVHYALVIDEYGAVGGIVTLDDILQALVGDASQFHQEDYDITRLDDGSWVIDGHYPFSEFLIQFDINDIQSTDDIVTVAGLVLDILRDIPKEGEVMEWKGLSLKVVEMENARIKKVLVRQERQ